MPDQHVANPDEIERMMRNLCAYALSEPDPLQRYLNLTHQQAVFAGVVTALQAERGRALADLADGGASMDKLVSDSGQTPAQVRALAKAAGRTLPRATSKRAAPKRAAPKRAVPKRAVPTRSAPEPAAHEPAGSNPNASEAAAPKAAASRPVTPNGAASKPAGATPGSTRGVAGRAAARRTPLLPPTVTAPNGSRVLTPEERAALGLPTTGRIGATRRRG